MVEDASVRIKAIKLLGAVFSVIAFDDQMRKGQWISFMRRFLTLLLLLALSKFPPLPPSPDRSETLAAISPVSLLSSNDDHLTKILKSGSAVHDSMLVTSGILI